MDHILGRRNCISSLRKDLVDIQASVLDVLSRTGPVCQTSWKFPDKSSFDLDMLALLEKYDYVENEKTSNQISHVALLELIIDRYVLTIN
uniref:Uncharacterized protein n=1 Tax=Gouania willdenowi TaxID=441366 RepID=A0A8C5NAZ3_GOUWI